MSAEATDKTPAATIQAGPRWWLFAACVLVSLTNEVSTAVMNLSLGPMRRDLNASAAVMQMAVTLGKLMLGAFMLAGGVAGDVYGRRRVLVLGALGVAAASLLAAVAQTGGMLLLARALDGLPAPPSRPWRSPWSPAPSAKQNKRASSGFFPGCPGLARRSGRSAPAS